MSSGSESSSRPREEFDELIRALASSDSVGAAKAIDTSIWDRFGRSGAAFISDMANFSSTSRTLGISHFLKLIYRAREIIEPIIHANNGMLLTIFALGYYLVLLGDSARPAFVRAIWTTLLFLMALLMKEEAVVIPVIGGLLLCGSGKKINRKKEITHEF